MSARQTGASGVRTASGAVQYRMRLTSRWYLPIALFIDIAGTALPVALVFRAESQPTLTVRHSRRARLAERPGLSAPVPGSGSGESGRCAARPARLAGPAGRAGRVAGRCQSAARATALPDRTPSVPAAHARPAQADLPSASPPPDQKAQAVTRVLVVGEPSAASGVGRTSGRPCRTIRTSWWASSRPAPAEEHQRVPASRPDGLRQPRRHRRGRPAAAGHRARSCRPTS